MPRTRATGLLLVNLGTPDAPTTAAVRRYLREFLSDPLVMDIHPVARFLLLNLVILPLRPRRSAAAYRQIWTERGSPLLVHGVDLRDAVRARLPEWRVELAMRYGRPAIAAGLEALADRDYERVVVFPLYPQRAASTTGSTVAAALRAARGRFDGKRLLFVEPFYDHPGFADPVAQAGERAIAEFRPDHVLFSYHGLPERHLRAADPAGGRCLATVDCCTAIDEVNAGCYRAQCFATTRALAARLGLGEGAHSTAFQSRLGRTPWIGPYTDQALDRLAAAGCRRVLVLCPSFVADCLETLEEIALRAAATFREAGGEALSVAPCLNASPAWADGVARIARETLESDPGIGPGNRTREP